MSNSNSDSLLIPESRAIVHDLLKPNPLVYWVDVLITLAIGYTACGIYFLTPAFAPMWSWQQAACFVIAAFAFHRVANFMHELAHFRRTKSMQSFYYGWNILAGVPMMIPSYFFEAHLAHHTTEHFGTDSDCEYVPVGKGPLREIARFFGQLFLQPIYVLTRFIIVAPLEFVHPGIRRWTLNRFSKFVFVWRCNHELPHDAPRRFYMLMDVLCWLRATAIFVIPAVSPIVGWDQPFKLYALAVFTLFLHYFRSLGAHHYVSDHKPVSFRDQLLDSINIKGWGLLTELLFPVGLRYHALHHLFPQMPYHNLGKAHRRLMEQLPKDALYRQLEYPSFWSVLKSLFRNARKGGATIETIHGQAGATT
jgi:fatty acid desaturase